MRATTGSMMNANRTQRIDAVGEHCESLDDWAIKISGVSKCFPMYAHPSDRLKQFLVPRLQRIAGQQPKQYYREFWALRNADFEIKRGESVGLIGRNGSGKSTLLQLIAGTLAPSSGSIEVKGRVSALLELGSGFNPEFTGRDNIYLNASILGMDRSAIEERLDDILAFADIGEFIDQPLKTCSSGMMMRLAFAVAVSVDPEILIVDEALVVGDAAFQYKCLARIQQMLDSGLTFLFVSHDLAAVRTFCSRAAYLRKGMIAFDGSAFEAGEAYLQELRAAQRDDDESDEDVIIRQKPRLPGSCGSAFGTQLGNVSEAVFKGSAGRHALFDFGKCIVVTIDVEYGFRVQFPRVALAITDNRHVNIGGLYSPVLKACLSKDEKIKLRMNFSFSARLNAGRYHITVALEDRVSPQQVLLVDKQGSVLSFDMLPEPESRLIGICDLGIAIDFSAPPCEPMLTS